ncbi:hypothetical protein GE061_002660 [Apolygus lucorum]|uniref:Dynein heavy chain tail domain-containing protein n=1 Tax=Apolygus lucorum TaxID=248454 RepID=A0A8S9X742_APOLU|nr:hypothetical protein GE061_002660 [Apolygus lucorum]
MEEEAQERRSSPPGEVSTAPTSEERYEQEVFEVKEMEDPRVVWVLERIMAFCQTEDRDMIVRMLKKHDHRALRKLYRLINDDGNDYKNGFFVYRTQFKRRFRKNVRFMKIHMREGDERRYWCSVETQVQYREETFFQLHLHFGLHRWERMPYKGQLFYFLPREKTCARFETLREAQAMMPKMFYIGQLDLKSVRNYRTLSSSLQLYLKQMFLNPTNPFAFKSTIPPNLKKSHAEIKRPSIFVIENSSSYMKKSEEIEKFFTSEDVPVYPTFNLQLFKRLDTYGMTKKREKFNIYTIDDFLNPEIFAKNPKIRSLWYKKKKGPIPKFKDRTKVALMDMSPPKSKMLNAFQKFIENFDWCLSKVSQCTLNVLFTEFLAKLDIHKFDDDPILKETHLLFLKGVLEIWNLHIKNLLKYAGTVQIKGKGVIALYEFYKERRDKISNLIFEMFHPIVENLLTFVHPNAPALVEEFRDIRSQLENFYIICWDTCEYLELCLDELEVIHNHKLLRPIIPCSLRFLNVLKLLLTLSFYWKSRNRFLDILNRLHYIIQSKVERLLNTKVLFRLPNRVASALCKDVIYVSEFWQSTVEQDRAFSQKINFEKLIHLRDVAQSILEILRVMKSYNHVYCQQCYDAESENYKLDAVVYEVKQLIQPITSPGFDYLDVDNKAQWLELVQGFQTRCSQFDKEASLLILDAIKKTKSTRNIANILTHFKTSTKLFKMDNLFSDIFSELDISPQFSQEILHILEIFLKASYYKDSMRSFGLASKSMQWTRCLFYVVQKNLSILFSIGTVLSNVFDKIISNYLRCVDIFTSYEVGLYKVWLRRFVNYTHKVVSKKLIQLAYEKEVGGDEGDGGCQGFLDPDFFVKFPLADWNSDFPKALKEECPHGLRNLCKYLPQFRPYLTETYDDQVEHLASLHSFSSPDEDKEPTEDVAYKKNLLIKFGLDLDNWYTERYMLNYNFVTRLALGMCVQNDEKLEASVYFLLEQILKRFIEEDDKIVCRREKSKVYEGCPFFLPYDCCSSSGSVTRISELLTEKSWSRNSDDPEAEVNHFLVDRNPKLMKTIVDLNYVKTDDVPLFIAIREQFKQKVFAVAGGDPNEWKRKFKQKTAEVLAVDEDSECEENFPLPELEDYHVAKEQENKEIVEMEDLEKYKVLFKTPVDNLYNYKEIAFVLWLNGTKMKYIKPSKPKDANVAKNGSVEYQNFNKVNDLKYVCDCGRPGGAVTPRCPECDFDWLNFDPQRWKVLKAEESATRRLSADNYDITSSRATPQDCKINKRRKIFRRGNIDKYDNPMNDIFVDEETADSQFRKKFNIYLAKLINESSQPGETIGPNEISARIRGDVMVDGKRDKNLSSFIYEVTDDDMPEQKINNEINYILEVQRNFSKTTKGRFKKELQEAIRQADFGSSGSEKVMQALDYEDEIRKTIPGIYTGCKHSLSRMNWVNFIGGDILKEHGYTIQANREPFTYVACRDIETLEEFGFMLPSETLAFAFNNFDRNKHDIFEIVTMYKGIIGQFSNAKLMALKKYIRPVERNICQGLTFCGLRTLNITKQCRELIVQMNTLTIVEILMAEVEGSIKSTLDTIGRLNFFRMPCGKSYSVKEFFNTLNKNVSHTQSRLRRLYKLIPQKLWKLETLLFQQRTGKCEYMITYYRCVEKTLFRKMVTMVKANYEIFRRFVMGELKARFYVNASIVEPSVCCVPELKVVNQQLQSVVDKIIRYQHKLPRWFDGTCAKVPHLKRKGKTKNTHSYSFAEDMLGSEEVVESLQETYECINYVLDAVDQYIYKWTRFDHLWTEDMEDVFVKFALDKPPLQDFFEVFNFYHQIIVELYRMPDQVDIFCVRVKIKEMKKKALLYALGWRSWTKRMVSEAIVTESKNMYLVLLDLFEELAMKVASFRSMKHLLKTAYLFGNLELSVEILLNSITAKNLMIHLWMPTHMYEESAIIGLIKDNLKQLKYLVLYRRELVMPYLYKITPRYECVQCSPTGTITDITKAQNEFPKFYTGALKESNFGQSLRTLLINLIDEVESLTFDACPWGVVELTLEQMRYGLKVIDWLKRLHPKLNFNKLMTTKKILEYLNMQKHAVDDKLEGSSLDTMLKALK